MGSRITTFIFLFLIPLLATAQTITTDTKDYQTARQRLYVGTDTSRYVTNIPTAINSSSTKRDLATGKAVWDALSSFITTITTDATLSGAGTSGSPLKIAPQGATTGQVLKYNGTTWLPGADLGTTYTGGTGISVAGTVISNTAPDQVVTIAGATGTYPNFTVTPGITGSGTTNFVPKWATSGTLGNSAVIAYTDSTSITNPLMVRRINMNGDPRPYGIPLDLYFKFRNNYYQNPFLVENAAGAVLLRVRPDGPITIGSTSDGTFSSISLVSGTSTAVFSQGTMNFTGGNVAFTNSSGIMSFAVNANITNANLGSHQRFGNSYGIAHTAGDYTQTKFIGNFVPLSGNGNIKYLELTPGINQQGGANGTVIGLDYNPSVTNINGAHYGLLVRKGYTGLGTATPLSTLHIQGTGATSSTYTLIATNNSAATATASIATTDAGNTGFGTNAPQKRGHFVGNIRVTDLDTDAAAPATTGTTRMVITDANGDLSFANIPATGITGTAAANAVPYWNSGATALTTGGMTKDATNLNLESGLGLKLLSTAAANMILNATATEGTIQTYGSVPLKLNPLGNGIYLGGITGGTGKAVSISAGGLLGSIDVGSGTVTTASVATANGFSGTVATATTTPAITISTTVTGILKGNGTSISAATPGTDYVTPTMSANQTITTGNFAFMLDASTASSVISNPFTIRGKADGTNSTQAITFQNAAGTAQSTINITNVGTYFSAVSGKNLILGVGTTGYLFKESGSLQFQNLTVSPSASGNRGGLSYNSTVDRLVYSDGANNYSLATLSDLTNTLSTFASDATPSGAATGNIVDAFSAPRTVTLGSNMIEGRIYTVKGRRNSTNTITVNSESGYTLEIDKDPSIGPTTFNMVAGETITAQRFGTVILIKR